MILKQKNYNSFIFSFVMLCCFLPVSLHANIFDIFDTLDAQEMLSNDDIGEFIELTRLTASPEGIIGLLTIPGVDAIELLKVDLYKHTNVINQRSLLDQPLFAMHCCDCIGKWVVGSHIFYNQMNRSNLTSDSTQLCSYLALDDETFLNTIQNFIPNIKELFDDPDFNIDIQKIFALASNMSVQQRRFGAMVHTIRQWKKWRLRFLIPFYYLERNVFLNSAEQEAMANEFGIDPEDVEEEFQEEHFISDKLGFGDFRFEACALAINKPEFKMRLGTQLTLPTAFALVKGLKGSSFKKESCQPEPGIIEELFCLFLDDNNVSSEDQKKGFALLTEFGLDALDRLAANLLDTKLGNDGHVGVGLQIHIKNHLKYIINIPWAQKVRIINKISIEYLFPAIEKRFFAEKNNSDEFDARNFTDETKAEENLRFIEEELIKRLYPVAFDVKIFPGFIFHWISKLCFQGKNFGALLGFDIWAQTNKLFGSINSFGTMKTRIDICKAKGFFAYQAKIFSGINYKLERTKRTWYISLNADGTPSNIGIGKDFTITLNVEANF